MMAHTLAARGRANETKSTGIQPNARPGRISMEKTRPNTTLTAADFSSRRTDRRRASRLFAPAPSVAGDLGKPAVRSERFARAARQPPCEPLGPTTPRWGASGKTDYPPLGHCLRRAARLTGMRHVSCAGRGFERISLFKLVAGGYVEGDGCNWRVGWPTSPILCWEKRNRQKHHCKEPLPCRATIFSLPV